MYISDSESENSNKNSKSARKFGTTEKIDEYRQRP